MSDIGSLTLKRVGLTHPPYHRERSCAYAGWRPARSRGTKYPFEYAHLLLKDVRVANFSQFPPQIDDLRITIPSEFRP